MSPNDADGMANSVDPDQTAPLGAVWSGSALFAQAYLSKNLGSLRYIWIKRLQVVQSTFQEKSLNKSLEKFSHFFLLNTNKIPKSKGPWAPSQKC